MRNTVLQQKIPQRTTRSRRAAFTMIELLVVIVIIGILIALIVPAVQAAMIRAREATVKTEIGSLATAIAQFRSTYGMDPPSQITLYEEGGAWSNATSRAIIRRIWPQFNFDLDRNINNNGTADEVLTLNGSECLVFFLGGMLDSSGKQPMGFSKNPTNPFTTPGSDSREGPIFEFNLPRLVDNDGDNLLEYIDSIPGQSSPYSPYLYASSYEGNGYTASHLTVGSADDLDDVYRVSSGGAAYNPKTFQIISPGYDHAYGAGGLFDPNATNAGLTNSADYDNLTNFHTGRLHQR